MFRNDAPSGNSQNILHLEAQSCIYDQPHYYPGYPYCPKKWCRNNYFEIHDDPHVTMIVAIYRSPSVSIREKCDAIKETLNSLPTPLNILLFNVNWLHDSQRTPLYNFFIRDNGYRQLVSCSITDNTCIDHIYTNIPEAQACFQILETFFSDHKAICA